MLITRIQNKTDNVSSIKYKANVKNVIISYNLIIRHNDICIYGKGT